MTTVATILGWLLISALLGWIALPVMLAAFRDRPTLAWGLSRTTGLLLVGWVLWIGSTVGHLPFNRPWILAGTAALAALSTAWSLGPGRRGLRAIDSVTLRWQEALFHGAFLGYLAVRGFNPEIRIGEKLSDAMFLSSLLNGSHLPPTDLWLSGHPVNYYYFGYFLLASVAKILGTPVGVAFNLSLALLFALSVSGMAALLATWLGASEQRDAARWIIWGLALEFVLGNLAGGARLLHNVVAASAAPWDRLGMGATRVLAFTNQPAGFTISEFPSFSFLFADLHPHLIAIPFSFLYIAGAYVLLGAGARRLGPTFWALMALTMGGLGAMNSWELPVALMTLLIAGMLGPMRAPGRLKAGLVRSSLVIGCVAVGMLAFRPFFQHFEPPAGARGIHLALDGRVTLDSWLLHLGLFVFVCTSWLLWRLGSWRDQLPPLVRASLPWLAIVLGAAGGLALHSALSAFLLLVILLAAIGLVAEEDPRGRAVPFFVLLATGIALGTDWAYIHDRSNTIFKLYMPAWTFLALATAVALQDVFTAMQRAPVLARRAWKTSFGMLVALAAVFPTVAAANWNQGYQRWSGLDGMGFLATRSPEEQAIVDWLSTQPPGGLLEMYGPPWSEASRLSVFSGRPTYLGWDAHEVLWHEGGPGEREVTARRDRLVAALDRQDLRVLERALIDSDARYLILQGPTQATLTEQFGRLKGVRFSPGYQGTWFRVFSVSR